MASSNAKTKLETARALIGQQNPGDDHAGADVSKETKTWQELMHSLTGRDLTICPQCGRGTLVRFKLTETNHILLPMIWDSS